MSQKLLFPVLLACILQLKPFSCDSLQDVVSDFEPKLQQLRYKVRTAAAISSVRLGIANAYVSDRISIATSNVEQQLNYLQKTIEQAQYNSVSEEDLQVCQNQEQQSAAAIDTAAFSVCRRNEPIADLRRKIVLLKGLLAEIQQTVTACLVDAGVDTDALRACLQNSVDNIGASLQDQDSEIGRGIDQVIISVDQCVSNVEDQIEENILEVTNEFLRCLGNSGEDSGIDERDSEENDVSLED